LGARNARFFLARAAKNNYSHIFFAELGKVFLILRANIRKK